MSPPKINSSQTSILSVAVRLLELLDVLKLEQNKNKISDIPSWHWWIKQLFWIQRNISKLYSPGVDYHDEHKYCCNYSASIAKAQGKIGRRDHVTTWVTTFIWRKWRHCNIQGYTQAHLGEHLPYVIFFFRNCEDVLNYITSNQNWFLVTTDPGVLSKNLSEKQLLQYVQDR